MMIWMIKMMLQDNDLHDKMMLQDDDFDDE